MKVLIIDNSTVFAGAERSLKILLSSDDILNFIDILFNCEMPHQQYYQIPLHNVKYRYKTNNRLVKYLEKKSDIRIARGLRNLLKAFILLRILISNRYDIVHFNMYRSSDIFDILACKMLRMKVLSHVRTLPSVINIPKTSRLLIDHFICVSNAVRLGFDLYAKSSVIYNAIDFRTVYSQQTKEEFKHLASLHGPSIIISSIGQLEYRKAHDNAIMIMPDLLKKYPNALLLIVGSDPSPLKGEYNRLLALIDKLDLGQSVLIKSFTEDIELIFRASDIILSITREGESFGRIPIEAAVYGTPCIVTNIGAFKETVVSNQTGLVCEPEDIEDLLRSVERLLVDRNLYTRIVRNAQDWVKENFSGEIHRQKVLEVYRDLAS